MAGLLFHETVFHSPPQCAWSPQSQIPARTGKLATLGWRAPRQAGSRLDITAVTAWGPTICSIGKYLWVSCRVPRGRIKAGATDLG